MEGIKVLIAALWIIFVHEVGHSLAYFWYMKRLPKLWFEGGNIYVDCYDVQRANHLFYIAFWGVYSGLIVWFYFLYLKIYNNNTIFVYIATCLFDLVTMYQCLKMVRLYGKYVCWKDREHNMYVGE